MLLCAQVQHAFAPPAAAAPGSSAGPPSRHAAHAQASAGSVKAEGAGPGSREADEREAAAQRAPTFGQWGSAFHAAAAHPALPAPDVAQDTEDPTQDTPGPGTDARQKSASVKGETKGDGLDSHRGTRHACQADSLIEKHGSVITMCMLERLLLTLFHDQGHVLQAQDGCTRR